MARPALAGVPLEAPAHQVLLRGERSARAALRWRPGVTVPLRGSSRSR